MKNIFLLVMLCLFGLLSACNSTVTNLQNDEEAISNEDIAKGYLLIGVETNYNLKNIEIDGPQDIRLTHVDLKSGNNFILVPLLAGYYDIASIAVNEFIEYEFKKNRDWRFEIKPQTISYVGHLEIERKGYYSSEDSLFLMNRSTEALEFMEQKFPTILENRKLYYGGPGGDDFFDFVESLGE